MRSESVTVVLDAPRDEVFGFLARVETLPEWATEFARELRWEQGRAKVVNGLGEFWVRFETDRDTGVIDMLVGPDPEQLALFPTRVVPLSSDRSAFTFTMFQQPGVADELFDSQHTSLLRELEVLRARYAGSV